MCWRVGDLDVVSECDALDDFGQLVLALQPGSVLRQRALGADGAMPDRGEHALDRVGRAQVGAPSVAPGIPVLGREVVEGQQRVLVVSAQPG